MGRKVSDGWADKQHGCGGTAASYFGGIFWLTTFIEATLLLATSAVFLTTQPPRVSIVNFILRGPYICILSAFGLLIGGIITASGTVLVVTKSTPDWSQSVRCNSRSAHCLLSEVGFQVLFGNRARVYSVPIMLSYPFVAIGIATVLLAFGAQIRYSLHMKFHFDDFF